MKYLLFASTLTLCFLCLFSCFKINNESVFIPISQLSEVSPSGDQYPKLIPETTNSSLYKELKILFVLSHGVEDHEVYYPHQYFQSRGAIIYFACPENFAIISDFFKPTHRLKCLEIRNVDLEEYDGIYIPGGLPSSSAIRKERTFQTKLSRFYNNPNNKDKIVMMICSGTENLLDSGIIDNLKEVTGSPASQWTFYSYFAFQNKSLEFYKGNSDTFPSISYKSDGFHAHLVLGRNPDASVAFVDSISKTWKDFDENLNLSKGLEIKLINNTWYNNIDFEILNDNMNVSDIANFTLHGTDTFRPDPKFQNKKVFAAVASGADYKETLNLWQYFTQNQADVTFICPSWIINYKQSKVFLFSNPPTTPYAYVLCQKGFDSISENDFDVLIVPGGLFSTNGVLRNDNNIVELLNKSKLSGLTGSGVDLLLPIHEIINQKVVKADDVENDLKSAGGILGKNNVEILDRDGKKVVVAKSFGEEFIEILKEFL